MSWLKKNWRGLRYGTLKREFEIVESVFLFFFFKFLELNRVNIECTRFFL